MGQLLASGSEHLRAPPVHTHPPQTATVLGHNNHLYQRVVTSFANYLRHDLVFSDMI